MDGSVAILMRRRDEVCEGLTTLRDDIRNWLDIAGAKAPLGQHRSQLEALRDTLLQLADHVAARFAADADAAEQHDDAGALWRAARRADGGAGFVRRLWWWYADRFDQRRDARLGSALAAADEVVWSAWKRTWTLAGAGRPGPPPLPYVDFGFAANATPRAVPPDELRARSDDAAVAEWAATLPVPLIGLPELVTRRPWWLVVALHETGHHVQYDVAGGCVDATAAAVAVASGAADPEEALRWRGWSRELFADAYSVVLGGAAAVWAVVETERATGDDALRSPNLRYPPPLLRVAVARAVAVAVGDEPGDDPFADAAGRQRLAVQLGAVDAVVAALLDVPIGATSLRALGADRAERRIAALAWKRDLLDPPEPLPDEQLDGARDVVCGSVLAWVERSTTDPAADREVLVRRTVQMATRSRADTVRAVAAVDGAAADVGALLDWLDRDESDESDERDDPDGGDAGSPAWTGPAAAGGG